MKDKIFIYGLYVDDEENIRYVGKTINDINKRLKQHIYHSSKLKTFKDNWIQSCIKKNQKIKIKILEITNEKEWEEREIFWINFFKNKTKLTNLTKGGESGREIKYTLSYEETKKWVQKNIKAKSKNDFYKKIKKIKNNFITKNPREIYLKRGWISWGDFLGTNRKQDNDVEYISYIEAKMWIKNNTKNINSIKDWKERVAKQEIPNFIPNSPHKYYSKKNRGWLYWGDFLGNNKIPNNKKEFINYNTCKKYVKNLNFKSKKEWLLFCKNNQRPQNIPSNPDKYYKDKGWVSWGEFLGTNKISDIKKNCNFLKIEEAKKLIKEKYNFINSSIKWRLYFQNNKIEENLPLNPQISYKNKGWKGWGDFLDTGNIQNCKKQFLNFEEAKEVIKKYNIKSNLEWRSFIKENSKKLKIPTNPEGYYKEKGWIDWYDWLNKKREI